MALESVDDPIKFVINVVEIADSTTTPYATGPGEYKLDAEAGEFDTVEETITVENGEKREVTVTMEKMPSDNEDRDRVGLRVSERVVTRSRGRPEQSPGTAFPPTQRARQRCSQTIR